mmetsp:Transcript_21920/g.37806  ORF Transcript_21920/g.37806 Transcript_21920/m.37806 type:complete len:580 (-) Transcript_21920:237-1976(-)|eukprot:CAMPEP_0184699664 /NCGR_PEP_ID=MMETSP0313-20130426/5852_1 /TAXON_ID=2792 /ORGANISM="Porphyridium aerugineum, Strain SAG 1380-2" /LENGTH=579 /DNA_ID=CAMNT_0027158783 /DNA_START=42 /DNA_END=1781 /DNA_ORIENTATION=+
MAESNLLQHFQLARNPYIDRVAERTNLDVKMLYMHSDLQGFTPSKTTYLFFGRRGSGKTTIRLQMQEAYAEHNRKALEYQKVLKAKTQGNGDDAGKASGNGSLANGLGSKQRGKLDSTSGSATMNGSLELDASSGLGFESESFHANPIRPFFIVDLANPGHLTACLNHFQLHIGATTDTWDAAFSKAWRSEDLLDCILSYAATRLVNLLLKDPEAASKLRADSTGKAVRQMLLLAYMYAQVEGTALEALRRNLTTRPSPVAVSSPARWLKRNAVISGTLICTALAKVASLIAPTQYDRATSYIQNEMNKVPVIRKYPKVVVGVSMAVVAGGAVLNAVAREKIAKKRAEELFYGIRILAYRPELARVLDQLFPTSELVENIHMMYIGVSAHQKMDLLTSLVNVLGYEDVAVFGDCFDEVVLLDPAVYPGAIKAFAREVCRNEFLNVGRLHFFFPDSRLALDLNTDKVLKEARFDRHFVRDVVWTRHMLADLAEKRFKAAQMMAARGNDRYVPRKTFKDLFEKIQAEDFSSSLSKINTPRELMIMMSEVISRMEANAKDENFAIAAADLEWAVQRAFEQAV